MSRIIMMNALKGGLIRNGRGFQIPNSADIQNLSQWLILQIELSFGTFQDCCRPNRRWNLFSPFHNLHFAQLFQSDIRKATISVGRLLKRSIKHNIPRGANPKRLKRSIKNKKANARNPNWRINSTNFIQKRTANIFEPGSVNFSSGWLGQGHTVSYQSPSHMKDLQFRTSHQFTHSCLPSIFVANFLWARRNAFGKSRKWRNLSIWLCP